MVRQNDNQAPLQQEQQEYQDSFDESSEVTEVEEILLIPISEMKDRTRFLSKIGLVYCIYFLVPLLGTIFLIVDMRMAKQFTRIFKLEKSLFYYIVVSLGIKLSFSFFGKYIRDFATVAFMIDIILFFFIYLGLYFWLNERLREYYIYQGHYAIIVGITLFLNGIFYLISTFIGNKKKRNKKYKFLLGFVLTTFSTILSFVLTSQLFIDQGLIFFEYAIIFIGISAWNFYMCHNSYLLIRYRGHFFFEHEQIYAFFCFFGDMLYRYWHDIIVNSKIFKKNKKRQQLAKLRAKQQLKKKQRLSKKIKQEKAKLKEQKQNNINLDIEENI